MTCTSRSPACLIQQNLAVSDVTGHPLSVELPVGNASYLALKYTIAVL